VKPLKLVVSGPVGAGKTTFISSLSEIPVVETDELASEDIGKEKTTVALDFGLLTLDGVPIHLFGTPGQERFDFVWDILVEGALGLVLLVAGDSPKDFPKARHILEYLTSRHPVPFVLGVTRQDLPRGAEEVDGHPVQGEEAIVQGHRGLRLADGLAGELVGLHHGDLGEGADEGGLPGPHGAGHHQLEGPHLPPPLPLKAARSLRKRPCFSSSLRVSS